MYEGFARVYDRLMGDVDYQAWGAYYHQLLLRHGQGVRTAADVACGTGNMLISLLMRGLEVVGLDASEEMLEIAAGKLRAMGRRAPLSCQDMREFSLHRPVDAVVCACDGVNYLLTPEDVRAFFSAARDQLTAGGLLAFDVSTRHKLEHTLGGNVYGEDFGDLAYLWQNEYDNKTAVVSMQLTFFEMQPGGLYRRFEEFQRQRGHTLSELREWLCRCGFEVCGAYGEQTLDTAQENAQRMHIVARRT